jgi:hypothetical protein
MPPPVYTIDDGVEPDDAIDEWVDEPEDTCPPLPEELVVAMAKPQKQPHKNMSVHGWSSHILYSLI